jgi:hypothetical protein
VNIIFQRSNDGLTLVVTDPENKLIKSGVFSQRSSVTMSGRTFELVCIRRDSPETTLEYCDTQLLQTCIK